MRPLGIMSSSLLIGRGVGLKLFGAKMAMDAVSSDAGLVDAASASRDSLAAARRPVGVLRARGEGGCLRGFTLASSGDAGR